MGSPLERLCALEAAATPGPWSAGMTQPGCDEDSNWFATGPMHDAEDHDENENCEAAALKDSRLIAALRNLAPSILVLWEALDDYHNDELPHQDGVSVELAYRALNAKAQEVLHG